MAKSKEKKRKSEVKKESENVEKVENMGTLDVTIKEISDRPDTKTSPVIGYFPSGYDPLKNSNDPESESEPNASVKVYRSVNSRNPSNPRMQVVVGPSGSLVNFVGTNYSGEATTPQLCNYALGVLDKETGVLKMVPIAANRIFRLDPKVGGIEEAENEPVDGEKEEITKEEKDKIFRNLTFIYSTKQNFKRDVTRENVRQTEEPGMEGNMEQKLKGIEINTEAIEAIAYTANQHNIPPYDVEATSPEMAYPLDKIILKGDWNYLVDIFELVEAGSDLSSDVYPSFVCNRARKIGNIEDESKRRRMAGILSYMTHLIKYKDRHSMDGVSSSRRHKLPSILAQKFSSMFNTTKENRIPDDKQNLLISYVLVLSLFADDFRSDMSDIAKDLRINSLALRPRYEYLGCKLVRDKKDKKVLLATLPVPLKFQKPNKKRRQK
ncbi:hypothetical protein CASFOL_038538 [Castilleja foliolosa]|uniref:DNA-directed RNA polymerase I subunit rpa49 n=1 Tax=Castilleja foliolosa TaxID=1961234 RepID=A0ABD3BLR6_9LAMI